MHAVDFDELLARQRFYVEEERRSYERFLARQAERDHACRLDGRGA